MVDGIDDMTGWWYVGHGWQMAWRVVGVVFLFYVYGVDGRWYDLICLFAGILYVFAS